MSRVPNSSLSDKRGVWRVTNRKAFVLEAFDEEHADGVNASDGEAGHLLTKCFDVDVEGLKQGGGQAEVALPGVDALWRPAGTSL